MKPVMTSTIHAQAADDDSEDWLVVAGDHQLIARCPTETSAKIIAGLMRDWSERNAAEGAGDD